MLQPTVKVVRKRNMTDSQQELLTELTQVSTKEVVANQKYGYDSDILEFRGLNKREAILDNEMASMSNLSSDELPYLTVRTPRELIETFTGNPNGVFSNGLKLATVDGTNFKYDGVVKGTVTDSAKCMVDMNGNIVIFPDKAYYDYVNDTWGTFSSPDLDYACEWNNRMWGVKNGDPYIYASVQGDFKDWTTKNNVSTDSYFVDTGGNSVFTGIVSYASHVTAFKHDQMFEIYGSEPSNFQVINGAKTGLLNMDAISEVSSALFYLSQNGVLIYTGGFSESISNSLDLDYVSGVFGADTKKLYACIYDGSVYGLYTYDPMYQAWYQEDDLQVTKFCYHLGSVYALCSDGKLYKFNSGTESIDWSFETKPFDDSTFLKKEYHKLNVKVRLSTGANMSVSIKVDEDAYQLVQNIVYEDDKIKDILIPVNVAKCDRFQLKFEGTGGFLLFHVRRQFTIGSDLPST